MRDHDVQDLPDDGIHSPRCLADPLLHLLLIHTGLIGVDLPDDEEDYNLEDHSIPQVLRVEVVRGLGEVELVAFLLEGSHRVPEGSTRPCGRSNPPSSVPHG